MSLPLLKPKNCERCWLADVLLISLWGGMLLASSLVAVQFFVAGETKASVFLLGWAILCMAGLRWRFGWTIPCMLFGSLFGLGLLAPAVNGDAGRNAWLLFAGIMFGAWIGLAAGLILDSLSERGG